MLLRKIINSIKEGGIPNLNDEDNKEDKSKKDVKTHDFDEGEVFLKHLANALSSLERGPIE